ncbi:hypothetical protein OSB04_un001162 [Centaurea solstitialis]|uniref:Endonuclease/exonuclease/phosphatase domain-containing protein n=1 Tax=Centaurea solstitialis TaxID=347529 RepID=A0AA38W578_9ASTR|nr:hypothetical protein OSB04_un001162 [Centaurea solstitialis]
MINILTWNVRGLNNRGKQDEVKNLIHLYNINICAVVETHVRLEVLPQVCKNTFGRWLWVSNQASCSYGTRIILAWDPALFDVMVIDMNSQCLHAQVRVRGLDMMFLATFVYGANRSVERQLLWSELRKFHAIVGDKPWVLSGDFNSLLFPHDALGGSSLRNSDMMDFFDCVEAIEVFDLRYTGIQHTLCQKPKDESGLRRKLDRVMANIWFTSMFANYRTGTLPHIITYRPASNARVTMSQETTRLSTSPWGPTDPLGVGVSPRVPRPSTGNVTRTATVTLTPSGPRPARQSGATLRA